MRKIFAVLLALLIAITAFGCSSAPSEEQRIPEGDVQEVTAVNNSAAVATIGDEEISFSDYSELFNTYAEYYTAIGYDLAGDTQALESFQDFIIDILVEDKIVAYQAEEAGYGELNAEKKAEAEKLAAQELENMVGTFRQQAETSAKEDPSVSAEERFAELVGDESEYYTGTRMTEKELSDWILNIQIENAVKESFKEAMLADVTVSDEDIQTWYNDNITAAKEIYTANPEYYKDDKEAEELYGEPPVLYAPAGYSRILSILTTPEEAISPDYDAKTARAEELKTEYGKLAFEVQVEGGEGEERMNEIASEYKTLKGEIDKLYTDFMAPAVARANEAYAKLEAGENFAAVAAQYSNDTEMPEKGRLISNDHSSESDWSNKVKSSFVTLKQGEYSQVIQDQDGCHIIMYLSDEPEGVANLEEVRETIREQLILEAKDAEWAELIDTWKNDGSVKLNNELIRSLTYGG